MLSKLVDLQADVQRMCGCAGGFPGALKGLKGRSAGMENISRMGAKVLSLDEHGFIDEHDMCTNSYSCPD